MAQSSQRQLPFFRELLSPILLTLSPLQSVLQNYLNDQERIRFCRVNKENLREILPRMRMTEFHGELTAADWNVLTRRRGGPLITSIRLDQLSELSDIPEEHRINIKRVHFAEFGSKCIPSSAMPPLLESLTTNEPCQMNSYSLSLCGLQLPILPKTLTKLTMTFLMVIMGNFISGGDDEYKKAAVNHKKESAAQMMRRILSEAEHLTDVNINVHENDIIAALPPSVTRLRIYLDCPDAFRSGNGGSDISCWPTSLQHLTIDGNFMAAVDPIHLPSSLISLAMPYEFTYHHYEGILSQVREMNHLKSIQFGPGISELQVDVFALLPRSATSVLYRADGGFYFDGIHHYPSMRQVESLPDTLDELQWPLADVAVTRWPSKLRRLEILGNQFSQDLNNLPDTLEILRLPQKYTRRVSRWPLSLREIYFAHDFIDLTVLTQLPQSIRVLEVAIHMARRMIRSNTLPAQLFKLSLHGTPDSSIPFDVRLLPTTLRHLVFYGHFAKIIPDGLLVGVSEREDIAIRIQSVYVQAEMDMEVKFMIDTNEEMRRIDPNDPEERIPFVPKAESASSALSSASYSLMSSELEISPEAIASNALFYTESHLTAAAAAPHSSAAANSLYELEYDSWGAGRASRTPGGVKPKLKEIDIIAKLDAATSDNPISGFSLKSVSTPPLIVALRNALSRSAIIGPLYLNNSRATSRMDINDCEEMMDLMKALKYATRLTRVRIGETSELFQIQSREEKKVDEVEASSSSSSASASSSLATSSSSSSSSSSLAPFSHPVPRGFALLCDSLRQIPTLRTLVLRESTHAFLSRPGILQQLTRTLLSPECASIKSLDLGHIQIDANVSYLADLIQHTRTLKHLVLSKNELSVGGIWKVAQAVAVNQSLVTLNLAGNKSGLFGLHALRWALRQNRTIVITVGHLDFGEEGLQLLKQRRHARMKESSCIYKASTVVGIATELP